jgi:F-type H+-transporting ATPase subunit gamma
MELVSAAKMRKAQAQALASRTYAKLSSSLLENLAGKTHHHNHPLLKAAYEKDASENGKILAILISPDKGLAGALNLNLLGKTLELIKNNQSDGVEFMTVGKKGTEIARRLNHKIIATFDSKDRDISVFDAKPIAEIAIDEFIAHHYSKIFIIYTDFISTLTQKPAALQLLPLSKTTEADTEEYLFEPSADQVWDNLIYRTIEFAVFQSMLEAVASEHSARMVAMRNAHEASSDLIKELQLTYNQARQAAITKELSEISAAKLAMEG